MTNKDKTFFCKMCNKEINIPKNLLNKSDGLDRAQSKHNHRNHALIFAVKFKIYPKNTEEEQKLNNYFDEYAKAVNFAVNVINKLKSRFIFQGKKDKKTNKWVYPIGECNFCKNEKEIMYISKNNEKLCDSCYKKEFSENSMRKRMYPTRGRKVYSSYNIKNSTNQLSKTHYHLSIRHAFQLLKAVEKQRRKRESRLLKDKKRLRLFEEMQENPEKRCELPKKPRQRESRYIHISLKERANEFKGYTLNSIRKKIQVLRRNIEREEKSLRKKNIIKFNGTTINLSRSIKFDEKNSIVKFSLSKNLPNQFQFSGLNVSNKHGRKYFMEKLEQIKKNKPKYAYLIRKQINNDKINPKFEFYLQYTIEILPKFKTKYSGVFGIDRGIKTLACLVFLKKGDRKPSLIKFYSGKEILKLKNQMRKHLYFLRGVHNKRRKQKKIRLIQPKIDLILHNVSKKIVELAKEKNAAISFEKLERLKKGKPKQNKFIKYRLSQFIFKKLSSYVEYKAKKENIKIIYVPPEMTSQICSKCGSNDTQRPYKNTAALFKCNNCGVELNADYNAACNIAQKGLKILNL
ncbi:MAG: zinc ribbon domain-containing protein [Candidatus Pacearchaeota archaeon]|nr:zinc ribbon domain-containing protein [Candidatus Pacearchaeota archaeon]